MMVFVCNMCVVAYVCKYMRVCEGTKSSKPASNVELYLPTHVINNYIHCFTIAGFKLSNINLFHLHVIMRFAEPEYTIEIARLQCKFDCIQLA
jgi:hypothetical protein